FNKSNNRVFPMINKQKFIEDWKNKKADFFPHQFVAIKLGISDKKIIRLCSEKTEVSKCSKIIDPRDKIKFSNKTYSIHWQPWTASGTKYPRLLDRREWLKKSQDKRKFPS
ncbi:hypothetical protein ACFL5V_11095, partial [Fibrobacterota bacterium]